MKRLSVIFVLIALIGASLTLVVSRPDLLLRFGMGGDSAKLMRITRSFLEDIQFKDFKKAASYHRAEEQDQVDIPFLLERLFMIKPEQLDIMDYEIIFAKVDSSGLRARVKTRVKVKNLLRGDIQNRELMLYYFRDDAKSPWHMKLESSLRKLDAAKGKKH